MKELGYNIVPINPEAVGQKILGETCVASFQEASGAL
jgi:predicted CoA-binding protein